MMDLFIISSFSLHKMLIEGLESCGLLWCFYQLFGLSFWRHPFTADDPLVSRRCNATFLQIYSDEETNSFISWMAWGRVNFQRISIFGWTIALSQNVQTQWIRYRVSKELVFILKKDITRTLFKQNISRKNIYCTVVPSPTSDILPQLESPLLRWQPVNWRGRNSQRSSRPQSTEQPRGRWRPCRYTEPHSSPPGSKSVETQDDC